VSCSPEFMPESNRSAAINQHLQRRSVPSGIFCRYLAKQLGDVLPRKFVFPILRFCNLQILSFYLIQ
jgi:hypothetical protein